jgi:hypothetical protein
MTLAISLGIAVEIQAPRHHSPVYRSLPDSSANDLAPPLHICWKADIDRNDVAHGSGLCKHRRQAKKRMLRASRLKADIQLHLFNVDRNARLVSWIHR